MQLHLYVKEFNKASGLSNNDTGQTYSILNYKL
jgi:hypothetical protein